MPSDSIRVVQSVLKGLAGEAAPHARLVVKAGDKLLLLSALSALRTLELNTQVPLEPVESPEECRGQTYGRASGSATPPPTAWMVSMRSCSSSSSTGPMRPRPQVPGKKLDPLMVLPAHVPRRRSRPRVPLRWRRKGPRCPIRLPVHQLIPSDSFLVRRIVAWVIGKGIAKTGINRQRANMARGRQMDSATSVGLFDKLRRNTDCSGLHGCNSVRIPSKLIYRIF